MKAFRCLDRTEKRTAEPPPNCESMSKRSGANRISLRKEKTTKGLAMKNKHLSMMAIGVLALSPCARNAECQAQAVITETSTNTTAGTLSEFTPTTETLVVKSESATAPIRYSVTKQTTYVDETGAPIVWERVTPGTPISVQYLRTGDRLVASRVIVRQAAPLVEKKTTTTTTTTRKLTDDEKDAIEEQREKAKERREKARERDDD